MNRMQKIAVAAAATLSLLGAGVVLAQTTNGHGPFGHHGQRDGAEMAAQAQKRLTEAKAQLKITPAQEAAWGAFAAQVNKQVAARPAPPTPEEHAKMASAPAPERMAQHLNRMKQQLAGMEATQSALQTLYGVLTPEQRATADQQFQRMMMARGPEGGGHGGRHGHGGEHRGGPRDGSTAPGAPAAPASKS